MADVPDGNGHSWRPTRAPAPPLDPQPFDISNAPRSWNSAGRRTDLWRSS